MRREPRQGEPWVAFDTLPERSVVPAPSAGAQALQLEIVKPSVEAPLPKTGAPKKVNSIFRSVVSYESLSFTNVEG